MMMPHSKEEEEVVLLDIRSCFCEQKCVFFPAAWNEGGVQEKAGDRGENSFLWGEEMLLATSKTKMGMFAICNGD